MPCGMCHTVSRGGGLTTSILTDAPMKTLAVHYLFSSTIKHMEDFLFVTVSAP